MGLFRISKEKITGVSAAIFCVGIALLYFFKFPDLWSGVAIAGGVALAIRQLLFNYLVDFVVTIVLFGAIALVEYFAWMPGVIVPILLFVGGIYAILSQLVRYYWDKFHQKPSSPSTRKEEHNEEPLPEDFP